ncbi:MAG: PorP/SprF family type IX secretion system membrane protein [Bacteroidota bacterium]
MKKYILLLTCIFFLGKINAQQETAFSQYHLNHFLINPAATGANNFHTIFLHGRYQWTGLPNSPRTGLFSYQAPLENIGLGVTVFSEELASLRRFGGNFAYAYRIKMGSYKLALGMSAHYQRFFLDSSAASGIEDQDDIVVFDAMDGLNTFDANLGAYFYNHKMYVGFSVPNVIQSRLSTIGSNLSTLSQLSRQYIFTAGYRYLPDQSFFSVEPSILLRKIGATPTQALMTVRVGMMKEKVFTAFTYGTTDIITFALGYQLMPEARIAYSYDYPLGDIYQYTFGSHEFSFIYEFERPDFNKPVPSKRFRR